MKRLAVRPRVADNHHPLAPKAQVVRKCPLENLGLAPGQGLRKAGDDVTQRDSPSGRISRPACPVRHSCGGALSRLDHPAAAPPDRSHSTATTAPTTTRPAATRRCRTRAGASGNRRSPPLAMAPRWCQLFPRRLRFGTEFGALWGVCWISHHQVLSVFSVLGSRSPSSSPYHPRKIRKYGILRARAALWRDGVVVVPRRSEEHRACRCPVFSALGRRRPAQWSAGSCTSAWCSGFSDQEHRIRLRLQATAEAAQMLGDIDVRATRRFQVAREDQ